ncbi:MAG: TetR/AcrR family transcriptional regulator [Clostridia bacterium]
MKKIDSRIRRTYANLTKALYALLQENNFENLTVSQICEEAGVHRATFYKHFVDKYAFLRFYFEYKLENIYTDKIVTINDSDDVLKARCMALMENMLIFVDDNLAVFAACIDNKASIAFTTTVVDVFSNFIAEKISAYCEVKDYKVDMVANYYAAAVVGLYSWWFNNTEVCSKEELRGFYEIKVNEMCSYFKTYIF